MIKQIVILIGASVLAVLFKKEVGHVLQVVLNAYDHVLTALSVVFSDDKMGLLVQQTLSLILIPLGLGVILALIFLIAKKQEMPYLTHIVWIVWIVLVTVLIAQDTSLLHHSVALLQRFL